MDKHSYIEMINLLKEQESLIERQGKTIAVLLEENARLKNLADISILNSNYIKQ